MRYLLLCFVLLLAHRSFAQNDTTWFDKYWDSTTRTSAIYFRPPYKQVADGRYNVKDYYISTGNLQMDAFYLDKELYREDGQGKYYHENGNLKSFGIYENGESEGEWKYYYPDSNKLQQVSFFKNGFFDGTQISYYKNGQIKRREVWKRLRMKNGHCYDKKGIEVAYFEDNSIPRFPGGDGLYDGYMTDRMVYPEYCKKNKIHGRVVITTYFDSTGKVYTTKFLRKIHPLLDAEALRLVTSMPAWQPAIDEDGKRVEGERNLDILFGKD